MEIKITITGSSRDQVQEAIWDFSDDYALVAFTLPVRAADGNWVAVGRISGHHWKGDKATC